MVATIEDKLGFLSTFIVWEMQAGLNEGNIIPFPRFNFGFQEFSFPAIIRNVQKKLASAIKPWTEKPKKKAYFENELNHSLIFL